MSLLRRSGRPARVLATIGLKGGIGRSTITRDLAAYFALRGYRVAALEIENSPRLSYLLANVNRSGVSVDAMLSTYRMLRNPGMLIEDVGWEINVPLMLESVPNLSKAYVAKLCEERGWTNPQPIQLVPGHRKLGEIEVEFARAIIEGGFNPLLQLRQTIDANRGDFDVILIDTPALAPMVLKNAIIAADAVQMVVNFDPDSDTEYSETYGFYREAVMAARSCGLEGPELLGAVYNMFHNANDVSEDEARKHAARDEARLALYQQNIEQRQNVATLGIIRFDGTRIYFAAERRLPIHISSPTSPIGQDAYRYGQTVEKFLGLA